jgi:hypothetical protein
MKTSASRKLNALVICLTSAVLVSAMFGTASAQDSAPTPDIELDFKFLRLGLPRKGVISMLGTPNAQTESQTLHIKYHKLSWNTPDGQKFVAAFIHDRLWRWKKCSATVLNC